MLQCTMDLDKVETVPQLKSLIVALVPQLLNTAGLVISAAEVPQLLAMAGPVMPADFVSSQHTKDTQPARSFP